MSHLFSVGGDLHPEVGAPCSSLFIVRTCFSLSVSLPMFRMLCRSLSPHRNSHPALVTTMAFPCPTLYVSAPARPTANRTVVAKEPRVMALDMGGTVPRKLEFLARAFAEYAHADEGETADMVAQVLSYYPNALRFDPATLADKLKALRRAELSPEMVVTVVRGAPRCLSAAAGTLERRVSTLREAFPSIPLSRLIGKAPGLLQNKIDPAAQVTFF